MPLVKDEQDVKQKSMFLKYEAGDVGNSLILKSHLYKLDTHFLKSVSRSVECRADECMYCAAGYQTNSEYYYLVDLNGEVGIMNIKGSVFFDIQGISKAQKKDPRTISWTVIKTGDGLNTDYTTSKNDNLAEEDVDRARDELKTNTDKLVAFMERREEELAKNYVDNINNIKGQTPPTRKAAAEEEQAPEENVAPKEKRNKNTEVNPDDVPF